MKLPEIIKLLANRINQPHVIETYLNKVAKGAYEKGLKDAKEWRYTQEEMPICFEKGEWDGERSDYVIAEDDGGKFHIAILYSGFMDGSDFNNWYDADSYDLEDIIKWKPIN